MYSIRKLIDRDIFIFISFQKNCVILIKNNKIFFEIQILLMDLYIPKNDI
jgi:hypothetical protein